MKRKPKAKVIIMAAATLAVTTSMVLAKCGVIPLFVFYTLLILMHVWIFSQIGIRIYNLKNNKK